MVVLTKRNVLVIGCDFVAQEMLATRMCTRSFTIEIHADQGATVVASTRDIEAIVACPEVRVAAVRRDKARVAATAGTINTPVSIDQSGDVR